MRQDNFRVQNQKNRENVPHIIGVSFLDKSFIERRFRLLNQRNDVEMSEEEKRKREEKKRNSTKQSGRKRNKNCTFSSFGIIASNTRVLPCVSARRHYQADEPTSADLLTGCLRYIAHIVFQGAAGLALPPHLEGPSFLSQPCL